MPLSPPPRDVNGEVTPHDHHEILDQDWIIRRISALQISDDPKVGGKRISSLAFKSSGGANGGMSVDLRQQIEDAGHNAETYVTTPRWIGSLIMNVGGVRGEAFLVGFHPLGDNPHHGEVWGTFSSPKQQRLRELSQWFVPIPDVSILTA